MVNGGWFLVPIGKFSSYVHQLLCTGARCEYVDFDYFIGNNEIIIILSQ